MIDTSLYKTATFTYVYYTRRSLRARNHRYCPLALSSGQLTFSMATSDPRRPGDRRLFVTDDETSDEPDSRRREPRSRETSSADLEPVEYGVVGAEAEGDDDDDAPASSAGDDIGNDTSNEDEPPSRSRFARESSTYVSQGRNNDALHHRRITSREPETSPQTSDGHDTRSISPATLYDEDGYAIIPDQSSYTTNGDEDPEPTYTIFDATATPPKLPRRSSRTNRRLSSQPLTASRVRSSLRLTRASRPRTSYLYDRPLPPPPPPTRPLPPIPGNDVDHDIAENALYEPYDPPNDETPDLLASQTLSKHPPASPRMVRELGFLPGVVTASDARAISSWIHPSYRHQIEILNACPPMPIYVLDSLSEPIISRSSIRQAGVLKPVLKTIVMINYLCVGIGRLARARSLARNAMNPQAMESLQQKLIPLLRPYSDPVPPLCVRLLGRINITNTQHAVACGQLDDMLKPQRNPERRQQSAICVKACRGKNFLFRAPRFTRNRDTYLHNLDVLNDDVSGVDNLTMPLANAPYPTRDDVINEAVFCLSLGNMLHSFAVAIEETRGLIHCMLSDLTETLYYVYLQIPRLKDDYRVFAIEVATEIASQREDTQGLTSLSRRLAAFARRCATEPVFVSPSYIRYLTRCAALDDSGYEGYSTEKAAKSLADNDIFRPHPTEAEARRLLRRTLHFVRPEVPTSSRRQIPTAHIPTHASCELFVQASRMLAPEQKPATQSVPTARRDEECRQAHQPRQHRSTTRAASERTLF